MGTSDRLSIESLLQHDSWLRALATHLANDSSEAEDLVQETWLAALKKPPTDRPNDVRGWLSRVARNVKLQRSREGGRRTQREAAAGKQSAERGIPTPEEIQSAIELRQLLLDELAQIDEPLRVVLTMRYLEGLSLGQIAKRAGMPMNTAKSRIARGLQLLRERLDRRDGGRAHWVALCAPVGSTAPQFSHSINPGLIETILMTTTTKLACTAAVLFFAIAVSYMMIGGEELKSTGPGTVAVNDNAHLKDVPPTPDLEPYNANTEPMRHSVEGKAPSLPAAKPLVAGPGEALGQVIDLQGKAIAGVAVRSTSQPQPVVLTDVFGLFVWPLLEESQMLTTADSDWVCVSRGTVGKEVDSPLLLVVTEPVIYAGVIRDKQGTLLPNVKLMLQLEETWSRHLTMDLSAGNQQRWHTTSDANGFFRMERVPRLKEATLWLQLDGRTGLYQAPGKTCEDLQLVLRMKRLSAEERWADIPHMAGRVLSNSGDPLGGVDVHADTYSSQTNAKGVFRIPYSVLDETRYMRVLQKGLLPMDVHVPGSPTDAHGGWPDYMELRMVSLPTPSIRGRVQTSTGEPVEDCVVWLTNLTALDDSLSPDYLEETLGEIKCITSADGSFSLTVLPRENYVLGALDREHWRMIKSAPVVAGDHEVLLMLPDPLGKADVSGRCVDAKGQPIADVQLGPRWTVDSGSESTEYGSATVKSNAAGYFIFREQQLGFNSFYCEGSAIIPQLVKVDPFHHGSFQVEVKRRSRIHVTSHIKTEHSPTFMIYDEQENAQELYLFQMLANINVEGANITSWGALADGVSPTYTLSEGSYELRFMDGDEAVLRRVPIELEAGKTLEILID